MAVGRVPFILRTGKRLQERVSEIVITFEDVPHSIYERPDTVHALNRLVIQLQPEESITLTVLAKSPGEGMRLKPVNLSLDSPKPSRRAASMPTSVS